MSTAAGERELIAMWFDRLSADRYAMATDVKRRKGADALEGWTQQAREFERLAACIRDEEYKR